MGGGAGGEAVVAIIATTTVITTPVRRTRLVARPSLNNQPHSSQPGQGSSTTQTMHRNRHSTFNDEEAAATHPRSLDLDLGPLGRRRTRSSAHRGARTAAGEGASASRGAGRHEGSELLLITFAPGFIQASQYPMQEHMIEQPTPSTTRRQSCPPAGRPAPCP